MRHAKLPLRSKSIGCLGFPPSTFTFQLYRTDETSVTEVATSDRRALELFSVTKSILRVFACSAFNRIGHPEILTCSHRVLEFKESIWEHALTRRHEARTGARLRRILNQLRGVLK